MGNLKICTVCKQKDENSQRIKELTDLWNQISTMNIKPKIIEKYTNMAWYPRKRCEYGIKCQEITKLEKEIKTLTDKIEPYLIGSCFNTEGAYSDAINLLDNFPSIRHTMRIIRRLYEKYRN